jgi:hypothetical protein
LQNMQVGAPEKTALASARDGDYSARMQTFPSAPVRLLLPLPGILALALAFLSPSTIFAAAAPSARVHVVAFGPVRKVPYTPPETDPGSDTAGKPETLKIRALTVDGQQKEWTTGDAHDVTDRSFTIRRAMRLNDQLPGDAVPHWSWQPGPWLMVDRVTGHIAALHLPDFDMEISDAIWFRDYAAYCGVASTVKGGLFAIVAQVGVRRAVVQKQLGKWPQAAHPNPVCQPAKWQRLPIRVTLQPTGSEPFTFDVVGAASLIEEGDGEDN